MASRVDVSYQLLAAKYLRKQAKQLAAQLDGVRRAEDVEFLHQARVASRRLRAAMRMFRSCFAPKQLKRWQKQIRRLTTALGNARDKDVQIEFLCETLAALQQKPCYPGVARLLVSLEQKRRRLQGQVLRSVDRLQASGVLEEMPAAAKPVLAEGKLRKLGVQSPAAFAETGRHVLRRLAKLRSYEDSLADPEAKQRHHAMRIATKRLRYTLEIANPVYKRQLKGPISAVKKLQTQLGEIHDCDVWSEHLEAFAEKQRKRIIKHFGNAGPFSRLQVGIEYLQQQRREQRRRVFRELVDNWERLSQDGTWEGLTVTVEAGGEESPRTACEGSAAEDTEVSGPPARSSGTFTRSAGDSTRGATAFAPSSEAVAPSSAARSEKSSTLHCPGNRHERESADK